MADTVFDPVPESGTLCGLLGSLSVNTRVADSAAFTDGVKVTPTVQVAPAAMLAPQVFEPEAIAKSVAGAAGEIGTTAMLVKVTVVELLLVTVTVCGAVATPIACVPKLINVGDTRNTRNHRQVRDERVCGRRSPAPKRFLERCRRYQHVGSRHLTRDVGIICSQKRRFPIQSPPHRAPAWLVLSHRNMWSKSGRQIPAR